MNRRVMVGLLIGAFAATPATAKEPSSAFKSVPCRVFGSSASCVDPISEGVVDGQWIGLVYQYNGTNGGADELDVVTVGSGGNGLRTASLPAIKPYGAEGDRMVAFFRKGKLIVVNAIYLPGEAHCCFTHKTVRRFGFHHVRLRMERAVTLPNTATAANEDAALEKGPHFR